MFFQQLYTAHAFGVPITFIVLFFPVFLHLKIVHTLSFDMGSFVYFSMYSGSLQWRLLSLYFIYNLPVVSYIPKYLIQRSSKIEHHESQSYATFINATVLKVANIHMGKYKHAESPGDVSFLSCFFSVEYCQWHVKVWQLYLILLYFKLWINKHAEKGGFEFYSLCENQLTPWFQEMWLKF